MNMAINKISKIALYTLASLVLASTIYFGTRALGVSLPQTRQQAKQEEQYKQVQAAQIPGIENVMSEAEVKSTLEEILSIDRTLTPNDVDILKKADNVNKSMYFMLTGKTFEQQGFETRILPREEYDKAVHPNLKGSLGTTGVGKDGTIYVFASLPTASFLLPMTLGLETGHAYYTKEGPRNIDVGVKYPVQDDRGGS